MTKLPEPCDFAHVGKRRDPGLGCPTAWPLDYLERKLACAQGGHHRPPPLIGRVGLVVAPAAERDLLIQVEVGAPLRSLIDLCISNRRHGHKNAGSSEAVIKDRRSAGRFRAFLVIRHSAAMSSSRLSGRPLASVALKCVQTNSSGFRSGA